jgi:hypothetical protein
MISGHPMTLGNMRANGVRSLFVCCPPCHRDTDLNVDAYDAKIPVPAGPRMVCARCGHVGADTRANWSEQQIIGAFNGRYAKTVVSS